MTVHSNTEPAVIQIDKIEAGIARLLVHFQSLVSTTGTGGSISATTQYDCVVVRCVVANTTWVVENAVGNLDVI